MLRYSYSPEDLREATSTKVIPFSLRDVCLFYPSEMKADIY